ncbi:alpha-1,4-glucan branching enzyme [Balamuthia mandrillaris]
MEEPSLTHRNGNKGEAERQEELRLEVEQDNSAGCWRKTMEEEKWHYGDAHWQESFEKQWQQRVKRFRDCLKTLERKEGGLEAFSRGYQKLGFIQKKNGILFREWAPNALRAWLVGDFNHWDRSAHPCHRDNNGYWSIFLPHSAATGPVLHHNSRVKLTLLLRKSDGTAEKVDRIPAWSTRVTQEQSSVGPLFNGIYWNPPMPYVWKHLVPPRPASLRIYETHG